LGARVVGELWGRGEPATAGAGAPRVPAGAAGDEDDDAEHGDEQATHGPRHHVIEHSMNLLLLNNTLTCSACTALQLKKAMV
jgi:hypothetical protein